jgi:hypothetical protein
MALTIYFSGSISGGRGDVAQYRAIIDALEADGHRILSGAVAAEHVGEGGEAIDASSIFDRDMSWLAHTNMVVAEVSTPSIGVGYEIATARYRYGVPVVCLYRPAFTKRCSAMVAGDREIVLIEYDDAATMLARLRAELAKYTAAQGGYSRRVPA